MGACLLAGAAVAVQRVFGPAQYAFHRMTRVGGSWGGLRSGEQRQAFEHVFGRVDVELPGFDGGNDLGVQHQVVHVACGYQDPLAAAEACREANPLPAFDFFIDAAHREHLAVLVERSGHGNTLVQWRIGQR